MVGVGAGRGVCRMLDLFLYGFVYRGVHEYRIGHREGPGHLEKKDTLALLSASEPRLLGNPLGRRPQFKPRRHSTGIGLDERVHTAIRGDE